MLGLIKGEKMILDLRDIKRKGKDSLDFFFEYSPEKEFTDATFMKIEMPIMVVGTVFITGEGSAFIECETTFKVKGSCTRCLEETEREYSVQVREGLDEDSEDGYPIVNDRIDLTKIIDDAVFMNMPISFLCREDCLGLCPECGGNLNKGECKCKNL